MRRLGCLIALLATSAFGQGTSPDNLGALPATFEGLLPCADCPGVHHHLNLFADRAEALEAIEPKLFMRGMFRHFADAALFEECLTRRKLPVRMEGDYLALERAYLKLRRTPGEAILATLDGRITEHAGMEGPPRPTLLVERFASLTPGETCGPRHLK